MVGTTVRVTAASARPPQARQLTLNSNWAASAWAASALAVNPPAPEKAARAKPAPPGRIPPVEQNSPGYSLLLDPAAFLAAIANTKDRETFNKLVPSEPKPAPASKAAEIVAKPSVTGTTQPLFTNSENTMPVVGPGTSVRPTSVPEPRANVDGDLLSLGPEEAVNPGIEDPLVQAPQISGAIADLIDLDFSSVPQESLTPSLPEPGQEPELNAESVESSAALVENPLCVEIGGLCYFREDQLVRFTPPEATTGSTVTIPSALIPAQTDRAVIGSGYTIGVCQLDLHNGNLLGDHNLPRRAQDNSKTSKLNSIWADRPAQCAGIRRVRREAPVRVGSGSTLEGLLQTNLLHDPRPSAIGDQNLPGRFHGVASQDKSANASGGSSQVGRRNAATHPGAHAPGSRNAASWRSMTSEPRIRVVNSAHPLARSQEPAVSQRGRGAFQYKNTKTDGNSSDESELWSG